MILTKADLQKYSDIELDEFINKYKSVLVGSAIFTKNNSLISKIVRWAESLGRPKDDFIPSHVGSIVESNGMLYIVDMKPPKAFLTVFKTFVKNTSDDYEIILRDFSLNTEMFSLNLLDRVGEGYPYMSALRSILSKFPTKKSNHCSELYLRELQKQKLFKDLNPEITPLELYNVLKTYKNENRKEK